MPYRFVCRILFVSLLLLGSASVSVAGIDLDGSGGNYVIKATNLEGVLGVILEVDYDPDHLTINPPAGVNRGDLPPGTIWPPATKPEEGTLRIVIANATTPLPTSGVLARITFIVRTPNNPSRPTLRSTITATAQVNETPSAQPAGQSALPAGGYAGGGGSPQAGGYNDSGRNNPSDGEEFVPDEPLQPEPEVDMEPPPPPAYMPPTPARPQEFPKQPPPASPVASGSAGAASTVLERFRTFTGERSIENFLGLFTGPSPQGMKQEPAIVIADGKNAATVTVRVPGKENVTPIFNLYYARLISLEQSEDGGWVLHVVPAEGKVFAIVSALIDTGVVDFPLTVAPLVPPEVLKVTPLTEGGFRQFVKETGTEGQPLHDVNGDGKRDYIDDYIFSANYFVAHTKAASKGGGRRK